jgi:hypothetical protein
MSNSNSGAKFYKSDLHTHTPASLDYQEKNKSPKDFVEAALAKGLAIVAVTDHNSAEWVDFVRSEAKNTALRVFPGVEVTTPICHLLVIFELDFPKARIDEFLATIGISGDKRGKQEALADQPETVLAKASEFGAVVIAAHANSSNGLLKHPKGQYKQKICHLQDLTALEFSSRQDIEQFSLGKIPGYLAKACVSGSDSHELATLGQRFTYVKMDGVSLRGLQQALLDHEVRVRFEWNFPADIHPQIKRATFSQGFFDGTTFQFHPSLNCLVGGKGVGKSTVVELLRYCFDDISLIEDIAEDNEGKVSALLGLGGKVTVEILDADGELKTIEREAQTWETKRSVRTIHGTASEVIARPVFFSQGELTRIATNAIAQLELIDRYLDLTEENTLESKTANQLETNEARLQEATNTAKQLESEVSDAETGAVATKARYDRLESSLNVPILKVFPKWESERRYLGTVTRGLNEVVRRFDASLDDIDLTQLFPGSLDPSSPNYELLQNVETTIAALRGTIEGAKKSFRDVVGQMASDINEREEEWKPKFAAKQREYEDALDRVGQLDLRKAQANLRGLQERIDELKAKEKELEAAKTNIGLHRAARADLIRKLKYARRLRYEKRNAKTTAWQSALGGKVRIAVREFGNRRPYFDALRGLVKGASIREADLKAVVNAVFPGQLIELYEKDDPETLAEKAAIKPENVRRLFSALQGRELKDVLALERVPAPDQPQIEYEIEPGRTKPLNELSVGQKGTVIISLALVEGHAPLVIDQPEEPLDTLAIYDQIVGTLRREKDTRQFIFTTHNANVAVGADAELSFVLDASADKGMVKASGGVDQEDTNRLLLVHLEGGAKALSLRSRKYIK